jgi:hypothetical protein
LPAEGPAPRPALTITAVLRSWETRFGARLLQLGAGYFLLVNGALVASIGN